MRATQKAATKGQVGEPYPNRAGEQVFPVQWFDGAGPPTVKGAAYRQGQLVRLGPDGSVFETPRGTH